MSSFHCLLYRIIAISCMKSLFDCVYYCSDCTMCVTFSLFRVRFHIIWLDLSLSVFFCSLVGWRHLLREASWLLCNIYFINSHFPYCAVILRAFSCVIGLSKRQLLQLLILWEPVRHSDIPDELMSHPRSGSKISPYWK